MPDPIDKPKLAALFNINLLIPALESGTTVITPNNRLTSKINQAWGLHKQQLGQKVWHAPNIIAIDHWLDSQWQLLQNSAWQPALQTTLSSAQELILWEQVIDEDTKKPPLLNAAGLATTAQRAWRTLQLWNLSPEQLNDYDDAGTQLLQRWINTFCRKTNAINSITRAEQCVQILQAFNEKQLPVINDLSILGFQTLTPLHEKILSACCKTLNIIDIENDSGNNKHQIGRLTANDSLQEIELAARWAKDKLSCDNTLRIGVIAPELASQRAAIERIFREQFEPDYHLPTTPRSAPPFNISTATPLGTTSIIHSAMQLLSLNQYRQTLDNYCSILSNQFWGHDNDLPTRALAETKLRKLEQQRLSAVTFRETVNKCESMFTDNTKPAENLQPTNDMFATEDLSTSVVTASSLSKGLNKFEELRRLSQKLNNYAGWMALFTQQLSALKWPGHRAIDSVEYQQLNHWQSAVEQMLELDIVSPLVTLEQALKQLRRLVDTTPFQAETEDSPLQILGLLEGAGLRFDHLWIMGMDDRQWPPATEPNPLLPTKLQRELAMPRSSSELELEMAKKLLSTYLNNSADTVLSYCQFSGDAELSPSSLISSIEKADNGLNQTPPPANCITEQLSNSTPLEVQKINQAPAFISSNKPIRGGSAVLKDQANCPFNAFSKWRLGAQQPNDPSSGLSALDRGNILHTCLERFWGNHPNQNSLLALDKDQLQQQLTEIIESILPYWQRKKPDLGQRFFHIEQQRLLHQLSAWLEGEKQRPAFVISQLEGQLDANFEGLTMRLRFDRLDISDIGKAILIDYKTGSPTLAGWLGARPSEPQMPLYALLLNPQPECISYAIINVVKQEFVGLPIGDELLPGLKASSRLELAESWSDQLATWQTNLAVLANEYREGESSLSIYNKLSFTFQRDLLPLNRWHERSQIARYLEANQ